MVALIYFMVFETGQGHSTAYVMEHHPEVMIVWMGVIFFSLNPAHTALTKTKVIFLTSHDLDYCCFYDLDLSSRLLPPSV